MSFFSSIGKALKSKTVWAGIGTTAIGIGEFAAHAAPVVAPYIAPYVPATGPVGAGITIALGLLTVYGRVKAKQPLGPVIDSTIQQTMVAVGQLHDTGHPTGTDVAIVKEMVKTNVPAPKPD